jgi:acetylornithine/succinyldiaminopimelate/putrescine aminotransferase
VVLVGKAMGNGFPVSGVVVDRRHAVEPAMLPGSTFAGNPLAASAVAATLEELRAADRRAQVAAIEQIVTAQLKGLEELGIALRGKGALWVLELPPTLSVRELVARIVQGGVVVSPTASFVRLLPPSTIPAQHLVEACEVIRAACRATAS